MAGLKREDVDLQIHTKFVERVNIAHLLHRIHIYLFWRCQACGQEEKRGSCDTNPDIATLAASAAKDKI